MFRRMWSGPDTALRTEQLMVVILGKPSIHCIADPESLSLEQRANFALQHHPQYKCREIGVVPNFQISYGKKAQRRTRHCPPCIGTSGEGVWSLPSLLDHCSCFLNCGPFPGLCHLQSNKNPIDAAALPAVSYPDLTLAVFFYLLALNTCYLFSVYLLSKCYSIVPLYAGQEATELDMKQQTGCKLGKSCLKLNIQKTKMASSPNTSWQIDGETMETVR